MGLFDFFRKKPEPEKYVYNFNVDEFRKHLSQDLPEEDVDNAINHISEKMENKILEKRELEYSDFLGEITDQVTNLYSKPTNRLELCKLVDEFISESPEAFNSVRLYASYICYGSIELKLDEYSTTLIHENPDRVKQALNIINQFEHKSKLKKLLYTLTSEMIKYGDSFAEILRGLDGKIVDVAYLPSNKMLMMLDDRGDVAKFYQVLDKKTYYMSDTKIFSNIQDYLHEKKVIEFNKSEILHINDGTLPGFQDNPFHILAVMWKSLKMLEESLIIHRITRSRRIILFFLDVTGRTKQEVSTMLRRFSQKLTSVFRIDTNRGDVDVRKSIVKQGNDIIIPITNNSATKVQPIPSDPSPTKIDDLKFYHNKILANLMTSHIYILEKTGKEEYIEKALIRLVRVYQKQIANAIQDFYSMILEEHGLGDVRVYIQLPSPDINEELKLVDAIVRRMMVINQLIATLGIIPPTQWIIKYVFRDLTQPEIQELVDLLEVEKRKMEEESQGMEFPNYLVSGEEVPPAEEEEESSAIDNITGNTGTQEKTSNYLFNLFDVTKEEEKEIQEVFKRKKSTKEDIDKVLERNNKIIEMSLTLLKERKNNL